MYVNTDTTQWEVEGHSMCERLLNIRHAVSGGSDPNMSCVFLNFSQNTVDLKSPNKVQVPGASDYCKNF